jgi:adenylyltransferase/sulfurtransferase
MGIFDQKNLEKYSRQLIIEQIGLEGQKKIFNTSICIVGCGGLGTSVSQYLAMAGIGKFHFIDADKIELSNLNRQVMFIESDIGKNKAEVLKTYIQKINPQAKIIVSKKNVSENNIKNLLDSFKFIIDCSDNFKTRFLVNEFCFKEKKILISAALQNFDVQISAFKAWSGKNNPCYECVFPKSNDLNNVNCDQMGIVSPVAGFGGVMQSLLIIDIILDSDANIFKELLIFDCLKRNFRKIKIKKDSSCKICNKT